MTKDGLERIPAEEIEFVIGERLDWGNLTNGFDCQVRRDGPYQSPLGKPVMVTMLLCNRLGIDQRGPTVFTIPSGDEGPLLRPGMIPHLFFTPDSPTGNNRAASRPVEVPARARIGLVWQIDDAWKSLAPGETYVAVTFDVAQHFDLTQPGNYFLYFTFEKTSPAFDFAEGRSSTAYFQITERNDVK